MDADFVVLLIAVFLMVLLIVVFLVGLAVAIVNLKKTHTKLKRNDDELKRSMEELDSARLLLTSAQKKSSNLEKSLATVDSQLTQAVSEMDRILTNLFPEIETSDSIMSRLTLDDFKKLDLPLSNEFMTRMTQLAGQKMEAVTKLNAFALRLAFGMNSLKQESVTFAPKTKLAAAVLKQQLDQLVEYAPLMKYPVFQSALAKVCATNVERLLTNYSNGEAPPSEVMYDLSLQAINEIAAAYETEVNKPHAVRKSEQRQHIPWSAEVLVTAPPADSREFDFHYEIPLRTSTNGKGAHKKG